MRSDRDFGRAAQGLTPPVPWMRIPSGSSSTLAPAPDKAAAIAASPVGLLDAQFLKACRCRRSPPLKRGCHEQDWKLVDHSRCDALAGRFQFRSVANAARADRLPDSPPTSRGFSSSMEAPISRSTVELADAGRVHADIRDRQVASGDQQRGNDKKGCGRRIAGNGDVLRAQLRLPVQR